VEYEEMAVSLHCIRQRSDAEFADGESDDPEHDPA
jgi:hypothetical protein